MLMGTSVLMLLLIVTVFLPTIADLERHMRKCGSRDGETVADPNICQTVIWWHDESTFYAHDWR
jgi:hypothetical protein